MPLYTFECPDGHSFDRFAPVKRFRRTRRCKCGKTASLVLSAPQVFAQGDCHYTSPIDGREITSWAARRDDLARNHCQPYDPEMRKDAERFRERSQSKLEAAIDRTVESEIEKMPVRKREKLHNELLNGAAIAPQRGSVPIKTVRRIDNGPRSR